MTKYSVTQSDGNEPVIVEVDIPHDETKMETNTLLIEENHIQDYQLVRDREKKEN